MMTTTRPSQSIPELTAIPGPVDRVHFLDEQRRRRRQTWRFTSLYAVAAALVGVPLAMFLTPLLFMSMLLALRLADATMPVPAAAWTFMGDLAGAVPGFLSAFADSPDATLRGSSRDALAATRLPFDSALLTLALLLLPAMLTVVVVWFGYRSLFRRAGVGGELLALGAREPRLDNLEERQLVNVVEEMAIAAGLPPPRVRLLDSAVPNAAAIGSGVDDAVIVVSRGLLDRLDRDETQSVIAHLVGSVGNGDMRIALSLTTLFHTIELFLTAFDALFNLSRSAWRDLWQVFRCAAMRGTYTLAAQTVARLMDHRLGEFREDGVSGLLQHSRSDVPRSWIARALRRLPFLYVLVLPFALTYVLVLLLRMQVSMFRLLIVGPLVMLVWRTRRHLADATAVQLTRNPDGLAQGLAHLATEGAVVPGGQWFAHLFIVGPEAEKARNDEAFRRRLAEVRQRGTSGSVRLDAINEGYKASREAMEQAGQSSKGTWEEELGGVASHPPLKERLKRLQALGASMASETTKNRSRIVLPASLRELGCAAVLLPLMALVVYLLACVMVAVFLFGLVSATLFMGLAMPLIYALLT